VQIGLAIFELTLTSLETFNRENKWGDIPSEGGERASSANYLPSAIVCGAVLAPWIACETLSKIVQIISASKNLMDRACETVLRTLTLCEGSRHLLSLRLSLTALLPSLAVDEHALEKVTHLQLS
jgi:hypothetical protein